MWDGFAAAHRAMSRAGCNGPRDMTERDAMLEPFDALIGTWATEATHRGWRLWQLAETPGDRQDDLKVTYRRRD